MASASISGTSLTVTGLTGTHYYAFRVYYRTPSSSSYSSFRVPSSGTIYASGRTSWSCELSNYISMTTAGTYFFYVNIWDETSASNTETNTVSKTVSSGSTSRTHYARVGTGVSSYKFGSTTIKSSSSQSFTSTSSSLNVGSVSVASGYGTPYILSYNTEYDSTNWNAGSKEFTSSTSISTTFTRRITVSATKNIVYYPYVVSIYLDGSFVTNSSNSTNTSASVRISSLSAYTSYINAGYDFDYLRADGTNYSSVSSYVPLNAGSTTYLYIYFTTKKYAVSPTLSFTSSTTNAISINWNKNGGSQGNWRVYYKKSSDTSYTLYGNYTGTIATITGLSAGTSYNIYVMNYVSSLDQATSNVITASTQNYLAKTPTISVSSYTVTTVTLTWGKNGGSSGSWNLYYGTSTSSMQLYGAITDNPIKITGLTANTKYYFYIRNAVANDDYKDSSTVNATTLSAIGYFSWTSNDYSNIVSGNEFSLFITATGWNNLTAKINTCRNRMGYSSVTFTQVNSGNTLTADIYNNVKSYISSLTSAGTIANDVKKGDIAYPKFFANDDGALKEAINRAISALNY